MTKSKESGASVYLNSGLLKDFVNGHQGFRYFWEECKNQAAQNEQQKKELDLQLDEYRDQTIRVAFELSKFQDFLRRIPVAVVIGHWIRDLTTDPFGGQRYLEKMLKLQEKKIIPYTDQEGSFVTLGYYIQNGHQGILEEIRCVKGWSVFEKEEIIQCYLQFSHSLARQTSGLIAHGVDPDRERVRHKVIKYEFFLEFIQYISERDALIAKVLYFGAPSLESTLSLKKSAIDSKNFSIQFLEAPVFFPRHVIRDLQAHLADKDGNQELVFTNLRGAEVERAHLNQSFARACERMSVSTKITPGGLLKGKSESDNTFFSWVAAEKLSE